MRPKIVILTLLVAFGALGLIALVKGLSGKTAGNGGGQASTAPSAPVSQVPNSNNQSAPVAVAANPPPVSDEIRQALIAKEVSQIQDLQDEADGTNNPVIIDALLAKFSNPEKDVREALLQAFKQLNDTNAIPGLQKAADNLTDAREKVAVLDVIDYIKLPDITGNVPPELRTNNPPDAFITPSNVQFNPAFLKNHKNIRMKQPAPPAPPVNTPTAQPQ